MHMPIRLMLAFCCLALCCLSGCVMVKSHVTINADGSADVSYITGVDKSMMEMVKKQAGAKDDLFKEPKEKFAQEGYKTEDYVEDKYIGIRAKKHLKNVADLAGALGTKALGDKGPDTKGYDAIARSLKVDRNFFTTTYTLDAAIDLSNGKSAPAGMDAMANNMFNMTFALTLPVKPQSTNATKLSDGGRTMEWQLNVGGKTELKAKAVVPNVLNMAIVGIPVVVIVLLLLGSLLRRRPEAPVIAPASPAPMAPPTVQPAQDVPTPIETAEAKDPEQPQA